MLVLDEIHKMSGWKMFIKGIIFTVRSFHTNVARAILREPKIYFYDSGFVQGDEGVRLENTCAVCLLKHVQHRQDLAGEDTDLHYIRTREHIERTK